MTTYLPEHGYTPLNLKCLIDQAEFSREQVAALLGVSLRAVHRWCADPGKPNYRNMPLQKWNALVEAATIHIDWLVEQAELFNKVDWIGAVYQFPRYEFSRAIEAIDNGEDAPQVIGYIVGQGWWRCGSSEEEAQQAAMKPDSIFHVDRNGIIVI